MTDEEAASREALTPDTIARKAFGSSFRGYDQLEVRAYLADVARQVSLLLDREERLRSRLADAEQRAARSVDIDERMLEARLGEEAAQVLTSAREAARQIRTKAEANVARLLRDAQAEANRLRTELEAEAARRREALDAEQAARNAEAAASRLAFEEEVAATRTRLADEAAAERAAFEAEMAAERARLADEAAATRAAFEAEMVAARDAAEQAAREMTQQARAKGVELVAEAQAVRERVLADLATRRRQARAHLEQLRAGRERLLDAMQTTRALLDQATAGLEESLPEARRAAEEAGRRVMEADEVPDEDEARGALPAGSPSVERGAVAPGAGDADAVPTDDLDGDLDAEPGTGEVEDVEEDLVDEDVEAEDLVEGEDLDVDDLDGDLDGDGEQDAAAVPAGGLVGEAVVERVVVEEVVVELVDDEGVPADPFDLEVTGELAVVEPGATLPLRAGSPGPGGAGAEPPPPPPAPAPSKAGSGRSRAKGAKAGAGRSRRGKGEGAQPGESSPVPPGSATTGEPASAVLLAGDDEIVPSGPVTAEIEAVDLGFLDAGGAMPAGSGPQGVPLATPDAPAASSAAEPLVVDELFARLRASRDEAVARAQEVLAAGRDATVAVPEPAPAPPPPATGSEPVSPPPAGATRPRARRTRKTRSTGTRAADAEGEPGPPEPPEVLDRRSSAFRWREERLAPLERELVHSLAQVLEVERRLTVRRLRADPDAGVAALLPAADDQRAALAEAALAPLVDAARLGGQSLVPDGDAGAVDVAASAAQARADLIEDLVEELRAAVAEALEGAGTTGGRKRDRTAARAAAVTLAYREWGKGRLASLAGDATRGAFGAGAWAAAAPGTPLCWLADPGAPDCPEAALNAAAGERTRGEAFPSGHLRPPGHPGCRCLLLRGGR